MRSISQMTSSISNSTASSPTNQTLMKLLERNNSKIDDFQQLIIQGSRSPSQKIIRQSLALSPLPSKEISQTIQNRIESLQKKEMNNDESPLMIKESPFMRNFSNTKKYNGEFQAFTSPQKQPYIKTTPYTNQLNESMEDCEQCGNQIKRLKQANKELQNSIQVYAYEKEIFLQQQQQSMSNLSRIYEQEKKELIDQINKLEIQLLQNSQKYQQFRNMEQALSDLEKDVLRVVQENENCKEKNENLKKTINNQLQLRLQSLNRWQELNNLQSELKQNINQVSYMFLCLAKNEHIPLDMILQRNNNDQKRQFIHQNKQKFELSQIDSHETELQTLLIQDQVEMIDNFKNLMIEYQQQFIISMGYH